MTTHSLTGFNNINLHNLSGKPFAIGYEASPSYKINRFKKQVVSDYIVPLFSRQFDILKENTLLIDKIYNNLILFHNKYKQPELLAYAQLLKVIKVVVDKQNLLDASEKNQSNTSDPNKIVNMVYKTSMIRLLPEYEIYNSIIGKPSKNANESYDENIINQIKRLLKEENISYAKIKTIITTNKTRF